MDWDSVLSKSVKKTGILPTAVSMDVNTFTILRGSLRSWWMDVKHPYLVLFISLTSFYQNAWFVKWFCKALQDIRRYIHKTPFNIHSGSHVSPPTTPTPQYPFLVSFSFSPFFHYNQHRTLFHDHTPFMPLL